MWLLQSEGVGGGAGYLPCGQPGGGARVVSLVAVVEALEELPLHPQHRLVPLGLHAADEGPVSQASDRPS